MIVRELITKLGFDVETSRFNQFDRQVGQLTNRLNDLDRNFSAVIDKVGSLGRNLALTVSLPLLIAGGSAVKASADMEQLALSFEVMLGSAAEGATLLKDLFIFAARTPFEIKNIGPTAKQLLGMGIESDKLIDTLKILGDVSAGLNVPLSRLALNYGQVKTQGKLTGRDLRDFLVAGVPLIDELAKITGKNKEEVQDMISKGEIGFPIVEQAFKNMTSEGGKFNNLMDRMSKTLGGVWSNFLDATYLARIEIGKEIISALNLTRVIGKLSKGVEKFAKWFSNLSSGLKRFIVYTALFLIVLGPLLMTIASIAHLFLFLHSGLILVKAAFFAAAAAAGTFNAAALLIPALILAAVIALALFVEDVYTWIKGGDSITGKLLGPWEAWSNGLKSIFREISDFMDEFFFAIFTGKWDAVIKKLEYFRDTLKFFVKDIIDEWKNVLGPGGDKVVDFFKDMIKGGVNVVEGTAETLGRISGGGTFSGSPIANTRNDGNKNFTFNNSISLTPAMGTGTEAGSLVAENFLAEFNRQIRHSLNTDSPTEE